MRLFVGFVMQGHIYSNTAGYGEKWVDKSGHLSIFTSLKHLNGAFEVQFFQGFMFTPYQR